MRNPDLEFLAALAASHFTRRVNARLLPYIEHFLGGL
jgi:hypothetical protein